MTRRPNDPAKSLWEAAQQVGTRALGAVYVSEPMVRSLSERFREAASQVKPEGCPFGSSLRTIG